MRLTKDQVKEFEESARPLIKWLNENGHPHMEVRVNSTHATLKEGILNIRDERYLGAKSPVFVCSTCNDKFMGNPSNEEGQCRLCANEIGG